MRARLWLYFAKHAILYGMKKCLALGGDVLITEDALVFTLPLKPGMADQVNAWCGEAQLAVVDEDAPLAAPLTN